MFRIAFMSEDRKLADVLRAVAGQVHNLEVVPVVIGDPVAKVDISRAPILQKIVRASKRGKPGKRTAITPAAFGFRKGQTFASRDLPRLMPGLGLSPKSAWYCTMRMLKEKTIRRVGTGKYEVL